MAFSSPSMQARLYRRVADAVAKPFRCWRAPPGRQWSCTRSKLPRFAIASRKLSQAASSCVDSRSPPSPTRKTRTVRPSLRHPQGNAQNAANAPPFPAFSQTGPEAARTSRLGASPQRQSFSGGSIEAKIAMKAQGRLARRRVASRGLTASTVVLCSGLPWSCRPPRWRS